MAYKKGETYLPNTMRSENRWLLKLRYVDWVVSIEIAVDRDRPRTLNELKTAITAYIRNISQADLQKVFANKITRVQACIDARGHHFQTSNNFYKCTATFRTHYTECNRRNGPDFGRVFLRSNYTDITQNTYIQS